MQTVNRVGEAERTIDGMSSSIQNMCTVTLCLMEAVCMQVRAEEQEDEDKKQISLLGEDGGKGERNGEGRNDIQRGPPVNTIGQIIEKAQTIRNSSEEGVGKKSPIRKRMDEVKAAQDKVAADTMGFPQPIGGNEAAMPQHFVDLGA